MDLMGVDAAAHCVVVDGNSDSHVVSSELIEAVDDRPRLAAMAVDTDELFAAEVAVDKQLVDTDWMGHSFFAEQPLQGAECNSSAVAAAVGTATASAVVALGVAFPLPTVVV